jgi:quinol monooxygenase YgiN
MSLVLVEAAIVVGDPARRDETVASTASNQQATREDEPGCVVYCFAADPVRDDLIQVYELWESEDALQAHLEHPNYFAMRELLAVGGIVSADSRKHRIDRTAPVYDSDRKPSGRFD